MNEVQYLKKMEVPEGPADVVIDTDTYNEVDDQFAVAYLLANGDQLRLKGLYAAPFSNGIRADTPGEGMEKSYEELLRLIKLAGREDLTAVTFRGAAAYLPDENTPVNSEAAEHLITLAKEHSPEHPLYIIAIAAITNIASALLLCPEIRDSIVVVWLGGHGREYHDTREFNMRQDIAAARVVFTSGVPVVQLPCMGVVSAFRISALEMDHYLAGKNPLADFLARRFREKLAEYEHPETVSRAVWDVTAVAWLLNRSDRFMLSRLASVPVPQYDYTYAYDDTRRIRYVYYIRRDELAEDLIKKLTERNRGGKTDNEGR